MRYRKNRPAIAGALFIVVLIAVAAFAPLLAPYDHSEQNIVNRLEPPGDGHVLGTDEFGRDVLARLLVGSRISLSVGLLGVGLVLFIGCGVGLTAGYARRLDGPLMRTVDMLMSVPAFFLLLLLVALFGSGTTNVIVFIGVTAWMPTARLVRGQVLALREREFVEAAVALGASGRWVVLRHLLPNILDVIMVQATLTVSLVILLESSLSYLGLGAQPPTPSWGNMLASGRNYMRDAWWVTTFPGLAIFCTVMAFNFVGDGVRDALDVRM